MKIQYASDLHLEFAQNWQFLKDHPLKVVGDVLVLAGDITYLGDEAYSSHPFWDWASDNYQQVLVVPGNHEFYKYYDIATIKDGLLLRIRPNVNVYYNGVIRIGGAEIILSPLWARIPILDAYATERGVNDFRRILYNKELLTFAAFNEEHQRCIQFIKDVTRNTPECKRIIITHHVPSFQLSSPDFKGSRINGAFVSDEDNLIDNSNASYWIYGHSHRNINARIGNTECLSNQLGYTFLGEHTDFNPSALIEL